MTEADFEREAVKLFQQLGLTVGSETLDFFQGESVSLVDWKANFKTRVISDNKPKFSYSKSNKRFAAALDKMSTTATRQLKPPLLLSRRPSKTSDIGSEGSASASPTSHSSRDEEDHETPPFKEENEETQEEHYFGVCAMCELPVIGEETGCLALDEIFHKSCFKCNKCYKTLSGTSFFVKDGLVLCERDYLFTLDKCYTCQQVITDKVIRALGHTYHPVCFRCSECGLCLDGIPFAKDFNNRVYCERDFHKMFAPRCATCKHPIVPSPGKGKSRRLIALNLNFHVECYKCSECGKSLTSTNSEGNASTMSPQCYPINNIPLCIDCNKIWTNRGQSSLLVQS